MVSKEKTEFVARESGFHFIFPSFDRLDTFNKANRRPEKKEEETSNGSLFFNLNQWSGLMASAGFSIITSELASPTLLSDAEVEQYLLLIICDEILLLEQYFM
jgi:hypothetical protein